MSDFLIYGATGYTGSLVAREAARRGLRPVLAGRNPENWPGSPRELGLEHRAFPLDAPAAVAAGVRGVRAVLNCAGPFSQTARPLTDACLKAGDPLPGHHRRGGPAGGPGRPRRRGPGGRGGAPARGRVRRGPVRLPGRPPEAAAADRHPPGAGLPVGRPAVPRDGPDRPRRGRRRRAGPQERRADPGAGRLEDAGHRLRGRAAGQGDHHPVGRRGHRLPQHRHPGRRGVPGRPAGPAGRRPADPVLRLAPAAAGRSRRGSGGASGPARRGRPRRSGGPTGARCGGRSPTRPGGRPWPGRRRRTGTT